MRLFFISGTALGEFFHGFVSIAEKFRAKPLPDFVSHKLQHDLGRSFSYFSPTTQYFEKGQTQNKDTAFSVSFMRLSPDAACKSKGSSVISGLFTILCPSV